MKILKHSLLTAALCGVFVTNTTYANDILTGDAATACEIILCLSSSTRPAECRAPIRKYFSIKAKRWHETVTKRRNFLKLCPAADDDDAQMTSLSNIISTQYYGCDAESLNEQVESKSSGFYHDDDYTVYYRTMATLPAACNDLIKHEYTDIKLPKYICDGTWYSEEAWRSGSAKVGRTVSTGKSDNDYTTYDYFTVKKECWIEE